jgi:hypothetical protein
MKTWKILGYVAMATVIIGIVANLNDVRRYIRMQTM